MPTPREFTKNTGWGRSDSKKHPPEFFVFPLNTHQLTSNIQHHSKQLNTSQAPLFYLLPTEILTDIEIWVSGLEHCDKFKPFVSRIKTMCNPILLEIPHNLWTPDHNVGVFRW